MASISEIVAADSYRGQAEAGGGFGFGVNIDVTPLQRLATFKFYSDQAKWQEQKKQDEIAADNIGKIAAFDITTPLTPYADELKTKLKDIQDYTSANPDALTYSRNPLKYQELNKMVNDFQTLRKSATASDAVYNARLKKINQEQDPNAKAVQAKELDLDVKDLFSGGVAGAKNKILNTAPDLNPDNFKLPEAPITTLDVIGKDANEIYTNEFKFVNLDQLNGNSELIASGFHTPAIDENNPSFKSLSPERQQLERDKSKISQATRNNIVQTSEIFNGLLKQYKTDNPNVDITKITGEPTGDTLSDNIKAANKYNSQIDQLNELIIAGKLKDPTGKVVTKPFAKYNLDDGLSPAEIISMHSLQKSGNSIFSLTKKTLNTNDAIEVQKDATARRGQDLDLLNSREGRAAAAALAKIKADADKSGSKEDQPITDVAEYMFGHIGRIANSLTTQNKTEIDVNYKQADDYIRNALKLGPSKDSKDGSLTDQDGVYYRQYKDGKIDVFNQKNKKIETLNLNILKQRIAQQFHGNASGDIEAPAQKAIEKGFGGYTDLNKIMSDEIKPSAKKTVNLDTSGYTQVTETNEGVTVGVKDGKWYDVKTGKEYK